MEQNIYIFKIEMADGTCLWYPPVDARTYNEAVNKVFNSDPAIMAATLKELIQPNGNSITKFGTPGNYDLKAAE